MARYLKKKKKRKTLIRENNGEKVNKEIDHSEFFFF